jgi:secreted PhoX family phosphatase
MKIPTSVFIKKSIQITEEEISPMGHLPFKHSEIALSGNRKGLMMYKNDDAGNLYVWRFVVVDESASKRNPDFDYKMCYHSMKKVINSSITVKALEFTHKNPALVYGDGTKECQAVSDGFFNPYFDFRRSMSSD